MANNNCCSLEEEEEGEKNINQIWTTSKNRKRKMKRRFILDQWQRFEHEKEGERERFRKKVELVTTIALQEQNKEGGLMGKEEEARTTTTLGNSQVWMTNKNKKRKVNMRFILNQQYLQ